MLRSSSSAASLTVIFAAAGLENASCLTTRIKAPWVNAHVAQPCAAWALNHAQHTGVVFMRGPAQRNEGVRIKQVNIRRGQNPSSSSALTCTCVVFWGVCRQVKHPNPFSLFQGHFFSTATRCQLRHGLPEFDGAGFGVSLRGGKRVIFEIESGSNVMLYW